MEPVSAGSSRQIQNGLGRRLPAGSFFSAGATRRTVRGPSRQVLLGKHRGEGGGAPTQGAPVLHLPRRTRGPRSVSWGNAARCPYLPRKRCRPSVDVGNATNRDLCLPRETRCFWGRCKKVGWGRVRFNPFVSTRGTSKFGARQPCSGLLLPMEVLAAGTELEVILHEP